MFKVFAFNVDGKVVYNQGRTGVARFMMLFTFRLNSIGERMPTCGTPFS